MAATEPRPRRGLVRWLLENRVEQVEGPYEKVSEERQKASWWRVMCLTGVDYFSTLGYQPGIAVLAAGVISPVATLFIVLLTLFGALPMYRVVARESPHGQGSIAMLEHLLSFWKGKLFVLVLLGFVATDFIITITLSAADATAHIVENPFVPDFLHGQEIAITLALVALLGAVFLKGFREAIGIAVLLVAAFLLLNLVVVGVGFYQALADPQAVTDWTGRLLAVGNPFAILGASAIAFPALALGLSGFETGVTMMPLVRGAATDDPRTPEERIRNTRKLLTVAALIMSFFLLASSFISIVLIPIEEFGNGGSANGRALAYIAHTYLGDWFGTAYDISTIAILWFAGASAMAGLLNVVPRYLPRYGMAPDWTRAVRPLVIVYTLVAFAITVIFRADVDAQGGAYATGVLVLMTSAAFAVTLSYRRRGSTAGTVAFGAICLVFSYTLIANVIERPDGIRIAAFFVAAIVVTSLVSRLSRSTELRTERVEVDGAARRFIEEAAGGRDEIHIVAHRPRESEDIEEYARKEHEQREVHRIPAGAPILFLEVTVEDASEFADVLEVRGVEVGGHRVLRAVSSTVPNSIAAFLLHLRDETGVLPHCYFGWTQGNPIVYLARYALFGEGDTAPVAHEVLREAEPDVSRRPAVHVGGG